jgi:small nuclear ribonucleoprotein (snRNP)-like protein
MERRLMKFTIDSLNQEIRIKLKNNSKYYSGLLHSIDPVSFSIIVHNFSGIDERAEFKLLHLNQIDYFAVTPKAEKKE